MKSELLDIAENFRRLAEQTDEIERIAELCTAAIRAGNKILFCGNGGSAADSQHLAAELVGRCRADHPAMAAIALTADTSVLTSIANDYGLEEVFARQVEGLGRLGDVLIGLSTSGNSANVLKAFERARMVGLKTVALTGGGGGKCRAAAELCLCVPAETPDRIQEMHIAVGHLVCGKIEAALHG